MKTCHWSWIRTAVWWGIISTASVALHACTIFVLTESDKVLFFNNEDWSDPNTRIWFVPGGAGFFGCAYVGFDNGWAQGGLNAEGLAFDWVAGFNEKWERDPKLKELRGNPSPRMLETCRTVDDAVAFYETYWEPGFSYARILIADRSGASAVIGARNGKLHAERTTECRGFGYAGATVRKRLLNSNKPTVSVASGLEILKECRQAGEFATKYSNAFDLHTGDIFLVGPEWGQAMKLNLHAELKKGGHYYEIPRLKAQLSLPLRSLPPKMQRFPLANLKEVRDDQPEITAELTRIFHDALKGKMKADDYAPALWNKVSANQEQMRSDLAAFGALHGLQFLERWDSQNERTSRYRVDFARAVVLQVFTLNAEGKLLASESEHVEWK